MKKEWNKPEVLQLGLKSTNHIPSEVEPFGIQPPCPPPTGNGNWTSVRCEVEGCKQVFTNATDYNNHNWDNGQWTEGHNANDNVTYFYS